MAAAGCSGPPAKAGAGASAETAVHEAARFLARFDGAAYRVNVRYVDLIDGSVIAVRQGAGEAGEGWTPIDVSGRAEIGPETGFGDGAYRDVAIRIAEAVRDRQSVCEGGARLRLERETDGAISTMYRGNRRAWVVFAFCPETEGGQ